VSAFAKRRRGSLRSPLGSAKTGGKGIRTPDLLIANETLYQLSYTPKEEQQLSWRNDFSASDSENISGAKLLFLLVFMAKTKLSGSLLPVGVRDCES
jgi:hypothetical protein